MLARGVEYVEKGSVSRTFHNLVHIFLLLYARICDPKGRGR